jgi:transposase
MDYHRGMDVEQLRQDVRAGRVAVDRVIDLLGSLQGRLAKAHQRTHELEERIRQLESKLAGPTAKVDQPFSVKAEEKRQEARGRKAKKKPSPRRRGRVTTAEKLKLAERSEIVLPAGVDPEECRLSHSRPVWRLENGRAVLVAYHIYRGPRNQFGKIPGALGRSEFGLEIIVAIAYQVFIVGLSFDKVCLLMNFFQNLQLRKSQVDALLNQLSRHWENEFNQLCALLANSAVVHADETGWSINSVWAFLSENVRVLFFGVHKDADTLKQVLDPETFAGIVISDNAAVYGSFTQSQKCWAHLLRKAIKLTLQDPNDTDYRSLADGLLEIYRAACRVQRDGRLSDAGRARKVAALEDQVLELCGPMWFAELPPLEGLVNDYRLLCNEIMWLLVGEQLFTFVTAAPVETPTGEVFPVAGTNNEAERTLRGAAQSRKTGRTNKSERGARRQTVLTSVLESLRQQLACFTLSSILKEISRWSTCGRSCFSDLMRKRKLESPEMSILDILLPLPAD